jgi:hypothetical protein
MPRIELAPHRHRSHGFIFFFIAFDARGFTAETRRAQRDAPQGRRLQYSRRGLTGGENFELQADKERPAATVQPGEFGSEGGEGDPVDRVGRRCNNRPGEGFPRQPQAAVYLANAQACDKGWSRTSPPDRRVCP